MSARGHWRTSGRLLVISALLEAIGAADLDAVEAAGEGVAAGGVDDVERSRSRPAG